MVPPRSWYFPSVRVSSASRRGGFRVETITSFPPLPTGIRGWLETFAASFSSSLPPASRPAFFDEVSELLAPALRSPDGGFIADYMRLRFATRRTN
jgi:2-isopropylmalate synthase